jgi:hypothetical protein
MWDSLESVWLAAKGDSRCFVSVVPIPYYEIKDGEAVLRYEGGEYPDYVPITDWRAYGMAEYRPDIAYIHNAYDDGNLVTQVHTPIISRLI